LCEEESAAWCRYAGNTGALYRIRTAARPGTNEVCREGGVQESALALPRVLAVSDSIGVNAPSSYGEQVNRNDIKRIGGRWSRGRQNEENLNIEIMVCVAR